MAEMGVGEGGGLRRFGRAGGFGLAGPPWRGGALDAWGFDAEEVAEGAEDAGGGWVGRDEFGDAGLGEQLFEIMGVGVGPVAQHFDEPGVAAGEGDADAAVGGAAGAAGAGFARAGRDGESALEAEDALGDEAADGDEDGEEGDMALATLPDEAEEAAGDGGEG